MHIYHALERLTQSDVADKVGRSTQAVSKAENYSEGDSMTRLRVQILQELTGEEVEGPYWKVPEEKTIGAVD